MAGALTKVLLLAPLVVHALRLGDEGVQDYGNSDESGGFYMASQCSKPKGHSQCENLVKETIKGLDSAKVENIGARIGGVMSNSEGHAETCCKRGTEFDHFLLKNVTEVKKESITIDKHTAIFVIDVQDDFTVGSFGQPCWGTGGQGMVAGIRLLINSSIPKGATILVSKDYHPSDHCSFEGDREKCKNTKDYEHMKFTAGQRYVNNFPSHCTYTFDKAKKYAVPQAAPDTPFCKGLLAGPFKGKAPPGHFCGNKQFIGANLDRGLAEVLKQAPQDQVEVIYKGFHEKYDSFSATPHLTAQEKLYKPAVDEKKFTGGYALPASRAAKCHTKWHSKMCQPMKSEMDNPDTNMRSALSILNKKGINKIIVVGLVFDFCVKETAIFGMEAAAEHKAGRPGWSVASPQVTVLSHLTRPSFDGKPGEPFTAAACGQKAGANFCATGGGTTEAYKSILKDYTSNGVKVVRYACGGKR